MNTKEVSWVYSTLFSIPGMNEQVKIDGKISRKVVLLLSDVIERGLSAAGTEQDSAMPELASKESLEELKSFAQDCLQKAGLTELSEQMKKIPLKRDA